MQSAVIGIAVLVPAGRGTGRPPRPTCRSMTRKRHRLRAFGCRAGIGPRPDRRGPRRPGRGDRRARPGPPVRRPGRRRRAGILGRGRTCYADALVAVGRIEEADGFLVRTRSWRRDAGGARTIARLARSRGVLEAAAGRTENAEAAFAGRWRRPDGLAVPFERARIELAAGRFLRRAGQRRRAADLLTAAQQRFTVLGASPYLERCNAELAASGLTPTKRNGRDRAGLTVAGAGRRPAGRAGAEQPRRSPTSWWSASRPSSTTCATRSASSASPPRRQLPDRLAELD